MMKPHSSSLAPPPAPTPSVSGGPGAGRTGAPSFDVRRIRLDFPLLHQQVNAKPLIYLDNAATTQKPQAVIDAVRRYYEQDNANIHRGVYALSQRTTDAYEQARKTVQRFINAPDPTQVIFTRGATEGINLVAATWARANLIEGDEVLISAMEHHSNIVPWQMICQQTGARLRVVPINDAGELRMDEYRKMLTGRTKLVSIVHVSNSLGTINDVKTITRLAHAVEAKVLIDGAQWVAHFPTDVQDYDCDFYAFSGHKLLGPTGIGILYGKRELLESMPPYQGGGDMIDSVTFEKTLYAAIPNKFEAGTPHIAGAIGLAAAIDYLTGLGFASFMDHEHDLLEYATARLAEIPGLRLVGTAEHKASVLSFVFDDPPIASLDIGSRLDAEGIAIRTGHHCCQPLMGRLGIAGTARASLALYNTRDDVDALATGLRKIRDTAARKPASKSPPTASADPEIDVPWPEAVAPTLQAAADALAEDFDLLGDRDSRNEYVLDLANQLPRTFDLLKSLTPRVPGCMSEVHMLGRRVPGSQDSVEFVADADADIVRGLIAVLQRLYSGQRAGAILKFDSEAFFRRIGLDQFISSQRRNGLAGMIQRIRGLAENVQQLGKH